MSPTEAFAGFLSALGVVPQSEHARARATQSRTFSHGRRMLVVTSHQRLNGLVATTERSGSRSIQSMRTFQA